MASRYSVTGKLGAITVRGAKLTSNIVEAVTSAKLSMSTGEVTQLDLTIVDDDKLTLMGSGLFSAGSTTVAGSLLTYDDLKLEVRAIELSPRGADHSLKITARSLGANNIKRWRSALIRKNISATQFAALAAKHAGLKFVGKATPVRSSVARGSGENAWDTLQRLAQESHYLCFEVAGTLYFGPPSWLPLYLTELPVTWKGAATDDSIDALPTCRRSGDDASYARSVSVNLRGALGASARPGMGLRLAGVPGFTGLYMVDSVDMPLADGAPVTVSAVTPVNPT